MVRLKITTSSTTGETPAPGFLKGAESVLLQVSSFYLFFLVENSLNVVAYVEKG